MIITFYVEIVFPVHINLTSEYATDSFGVFNLPETRVIKRYNINDNLPTLPNDGKIAITVGAHKIWSKELTDAVDAFCSEYNAIVLVDHSSGYYGKYRVLATLAATQENYFANIFDIRLLIHIGEQSGDYYTYGCLFCAKEVWRVSEDGEMRDTFRKLTKVFEMPERNFFRSYVSGNNVSDDSYLNDTKREIELLYKKIPELPLSNIWLAENISKNIPKNSILHIGVSNTMRSWTFFELTRCKITWANVGCRGIDGAIPTAIGMSLANPNIIHYCVLGDLTFFYEINSLGNRHIGNNLRILLINNGRGTEFRMYQHKAQKSFGDDSDPYIAAAGHFGNKSQKLVKDYAENLGFEYFPVLSKEDFINVSDKFLNDQLLDKPMIMEVFTDSDDENAALKLIRTLVSKNESNVSDERRSLLKTTKNKIKNLFGNKI